MSHVAKIRSRTRLARLTRTVVAADALGIARVTVRELLANSAAALVAAAWLAFVRVTAQPREPQSNEQHPEAHSSSVRARVGDVGTRAIGASIDCASLCRPTRVSATARGKCTLRVAATCIDVGVATPARINRHHNRRRLRRHHQRPSNVFGDAFPAHAEF